MLRGGPGCRCSKSCFGSKLEPDDDDEEERRTTTRTAMTDHDDHNVKMKSSDGKNEDPATMVIRIVR